MTAGTPSTEEDPPTVPDRLADEQVAEVRSLLAAEPSPDMPPEVAARLDAVIRTESARRAATPPPSGLVDRGAKPALVMPLVGKRGFDRPRLVRGLLAAAVLAAVVGFGGYVLSASAGLNEPSAAAPTQVTSSQLAEGARALAESRDLDPHRFSRAWQCARRVTNGRITGLAEAVVDGSPALLVYTRVSGKRYVTVVIGCPTPTPSAGPSTLLPR